MNFLTCVYNDNGTDLEGLLVGYKEIKSSFFRLIDSKVLDTNNQAIQMKGIISNEKNN